MKRLLMFAAFSAICLGQTATPTIPAGLGAAGAAGGSLVGTYPNPDIDFPGVAVLPPTTTGTVRIVRLTTDNTLWRGDGLTWSQVGGGNLTVMADGTAVGSHATLNFVTGPGLVNVLTDTGSRIDVETELDTAQVQTPWAEQSGAAVLCASASASGSAYTCALSPTLDVYTPGMVLHWMPDLSASGGGVTTLNVDTLGAISVKLPDGASDPASTDILAGRMYVIWYDGTYFRLPPTAATGGGGGGGVDILRFGLCYTAGCGSETTINYIAAMVNGTFSVCAFNLATAATGSSVIVDVQDGTGASIFGSTKLVVGTGVTSVVTQSTFLASPQTFSATDKFRAVVLQNDSGGAAQGGTVQCR